ncbi:MAG TPA: hypothetical protein VNJ01_05840 [Bacteriovoracaceae bacterium]|nr:hypothetical protein [Bacteriovoracaceae bacterium]
MSKYFVLAAALIVLSVACNKKDEGATTETSTTTMEQTAPAAEPMPEAAPATEAAPAEGMGTPEGAPAEAAPSEAPAQ